MSADEPDCNINIGGGGNNHIYLLFFVYSAIIQIGLSEIDYSVTEDEGLLEVCAEVINGVLETDLTVAISSSAQDAIRE